MYPVAGSGQCDSRFLRPAPTMLSVTILQSYNLEIILYKLVRVLAVTGKVGLCLVHKFLLLFCIRRALLCCLSKI